MCLELNLNSTKNQSNNLTASMFIVLKRENLGFTRFQTGFQTFFSIFFVCPLIYVWIKIYILTFDKISFHKLRVCLIFCYKIMSEVEIILLTDQDFYFCVYFIFIQLICIETCVTGFQLKTKQILSLHKQLFFLFQIEF